MIILFQSILFYIPRWLWKNWEAGKIHALMMDLDIGVVQVRNIEHENLDGTKIILGCGKTSKEKTFVGLPLRQPKASQLVGIQIFLL